MTTFLKYCHLFEKLVSICFMKSRSVASQRVPRSEKTLLVRSAEMHCVRLPGPEKLSFDENGEDFN